MPGNHFDIVFACSSRVGGDVLATFATEVIAAAEAGFRVGLLQLSPPAHTSPLSLHRDLKDARKRGLVAEVSPAGRVVCHLLLIHECGAFPASFDEETSIRAEQAVIVLHDLTGPNWKVRLDRLQATAVVFATAVQIAPVSPSLRGKIEGVGGMSVRLAPEDWHPLIDPRQWPLRPPRRFSDPIVVGRRSEAHAGGWPDTAAEILAAYPSDPRFEIRLLGGGEDPIRRLGALPGNWRLLLPGKVAARAFLRDLDAYVVSHSAGQAGSFERNILEALAMGLPTILPPTFAPLFGDAALYARPEQVREMLLGLAESEEAVIRQSVLARSAVEDFFSADLFAMRIRSLFGLTPQAGAARAGGPQAEPNALTTAGEEVAFRFRVLASPLPSRANPVLGDAASPADAPGKEDDSRPLPADFKMPGGEVLGFLDEDEASPFSADLYIAAMARSGSTYLADLLTVPPTHWVMQEPWFIYGATNRKLCQQAVRFGWPLTMKEWALPAGPRDHEAMKQRYEAFLLPLLAGLQKWGAKEVRPQFHAPTISTLRPKKTIILTRDIAATYQSFLELHRRQDVGKYSERWTRDYCRLATAELVKLADADWCAGSVRIVRYEDLSSADERTALADWLDWPMKGDPARSMPLLGREHEAQRHRAGGQSPGLSAVARGLPAFVERWAAQLREECSAYQRRFGYQNIIRPPGRGPSHRKHPSNRQ